MAGGDAGLDRLTGDRQVIDGGGGTAAPGWDRYAHWRRGPAAVLLAVLLALTVLAALTRPTASMDGTPAERPSVVPTGTAAASQRDDDLALYDRIIARVASGEGYYTAAVAEQRASNYPVRPGLAVRLPTSALIHAAIGEDGLQAIAVLLLGATGWAWWRRLANEPGGARYRNYAAALVLLGGSTILNRYYFVLHEFWTGMLIALSLGLHRPGRYGWALAIGALALALREHALPYVLLMAAMALWRRDWREGAAWTVLIVLFALGLSWHLQAVTALTTPADPQGPAWLVMDGMRGWLSKTVLASNLRFLPYWAAGPLAVAMVFGWSGWRSPAGTTATFLLLGYALAFMLAGRANNFYWGGVIAPVMFLGLAFVPMAAVSLIRTVRGR
ncbi:hypothetical protein [Qipengyuania spongiae]|uniref:DUF2029 domain-containing protein n=1 Tax=Qipengyuania spongiae TaxID=2909673 RepID=A0ABY5SYI4_9SPHN|nr:hypothetical protein [Qipengyuania spongiae]UVI39385.1 hypothetical protein L1F33_14335 [Qipengyuania spongiae]